MATVNLATTKKGATEERARVEQELFAMISKPESEKRGWTPDEAKKYDELNAEFDQLIAHEKRMIAADERAKQIALEISNRSGYNPGGAAANDGPSDKDKKDLRKFSLLKVIRSQSPNHFSDKLDGLEAEMHQEAVKEARENQVEIKGVGIPEFLIRSWSQGTERRDQTAQTTTDGGFFIQQDVSNQVIMPLRNRLVVVKAGAQVLNNLVGNISLPKNGGVSVGWAATENATAAESTATIGRVTMTPKRLTGFSDVSVQLVKQTSWDVELMMRNDYLNAMAVAIDLAALHGTGLTGQPTGVAATVGIGSVAGGTNGLAPTLVHTTSLEEEVAIDNADLGSLAYITNPKVRRKLKNTFIDAGSGLAVWDRQDPQNPLNGYRALITNNVSSTLTKGTAVGVASAIFFGNWNDLLIGMWGGMDVMANPYTKAKEGQIEVIAGVYTDVAVRRPESFAAMLDALTT